MNYRYFLFSLLYVLMPFVLKAQTQPHQQANDMLQLYGETYGYDSQEYADAVMMGAKVCADNDDILQARQLLEKSDSLFALYGQGHFAGRDTEQQIFRLDLLSQLEYENDRDFFALQYAKKSFRLKQKYFGQESTVSLISALDLSKLYAERLRYRASNHVHNAAFQTYVNILKKEFCSISESERSAYWRTANKYIDRTIQMAHIRARRSCHGGDKSLASAAYNAILLSKGILLNTTTGFDEFVMNSGNDCAINTLNIKKALHAKGVPQSTLDSLDYEILKFLHQEGQSFDIPHLNITWQDVQRSLKKGDVAIEFYRTSEREYGALVLKRGWRSPKVIKLDAEVLVAHHRYKKTDDVLAADLLQNDDATTTDILWNLSKAIWSDELLKFLPRKGEGRVIFSADGNMLVAGVESFPITNPNATGGRNVGMSECFDLYRVSSTREVCSTAEIFDVHREAKLYGGLEYDLTDEEMISEHQDFEKAVEEEEMIRFTAQNRSIFQRSADYITPLEGTMVEVKAIERIFDNVPGMRASILVGTHGTEETFKHLSGRSPEIIHIATHGFYVPEDSVLTESHATLDRLFATNVSTPLDYSMLRSGLLMSGALTAFLQLPVPEGVEDGIMTAKEISLLDLRNTQLAALSACETALGDVTVDGISGLQRGFKKAGANSILMSLWKVDDEATCKLMTEFYSNWITHKMTKHDALEVAKKTVRETPGWEDPKYWAAFILLDGLD